MFSVFRFLFSSSISNSSDKILCSTSPIDSAFSQLVSVKIADLLAMRQFVRALCSKSFTLSCFPPSPFSCFFLSLHSCYSHLQNKPHYLRGQKRAQESQDPFRSSYHFSSTLHIPKEKECSHTRGTGAKPPTVPSEMIAGDRGSYAVSKLPSGIDISELSPETAGPENH